MKIRIQKKHPLIARWNHWVNFPLLAVMVWSGMMIYWAYPAYGIPGQWIAKLGFDYRLGEGLGWHFPFALLFTLNGIIYVIFLLASGHWKYLFPERASWKQALIVILHDFKIRKGPLPFQHKYNAAQRLIYTAVLFLGLGAVVTGFAIHKPIQLNWLIEILGGYQAARTEHFLITLCFVFFFVVHVVQVIRAGWNNFSSMVTGLEEVHEE